jgi:hypothetical protein
MSGTKSIKASSIFISAFTSWYCVINSKTDNYLQSLPRISIGFNWCNDFKNLSTFVIFTSFWVFYVFILGIWVTISSSCLASNCFKQLTHYLNLFHYFKFTYYIIALKNFINVYNIQ